MTRAEYAHNARIRWESPIRAGAGPFRPPLTGRTAYASRKLRQAGNGPLRLLRTAIRAWSQAFQLPHLRRLRRKRSAGSIGHDLGPIPAPGRGLVQSPGAAGPAFRRGAGRQIGPVSTANGGGCAIQARHWQSKTPNALDTEFARASALIGTAAGIVLFLWLAAVALGLAAGGW